MPVPQHLSMVAVHQKNQVLGKLSKAHDLGMRMGFAGGGRAGARAQDFRIPQGHVITGFGDTGMHGTYMETAPAENLDKMQAIGMVDRNLHPQQFKDHR